MEVTSSEETDYHFQEQSIDDGCSHLTVLIALLERKLPPSENRKLPPYQTIRIQQTDMKYYNET